MREKVCIFERLMLAFFVMQKNIKSMDISPIRFSRGLKDKIREFPMFKRKKFLKSMLLALGAFLILSVLGFFTQVFFFNKESATAAIDKICEPRIIKEVIEKERETQWLDYSSQSPFNFKFSYPENWHILINANKNAPIAQYTKSAIAFSDKPIEILEEFVDYPIIIEISNQSLTYKERSFEKIAQKKEKIVIDNIAGVEFSGVAPESNSKFKAIVFNKDDNVFVIYGLLNLRSNNYTEILDKVIKSIKFEEKVEESEK